jgi:hypothetical protein
VWSSRQRAPHACARRRCGRRGRHAFTRVLGRLETSGDPPAYEAGESGCGTGGQIAGPEVPPLRKARLGPRVRAVVDAADCGPRDPRLDEGATPSAFFGPDEAKPRSELARPRPGHDERICVRIASLPAKRWRRVCPLQRPLEPEDAAVVGRAVRVPQRRHSVGGDERTYVAACVAHPADQTVISPPAGQGNCASSPRVVAERHGGTFTSIERANGDPHRHRAPTDHVVLVPSVDADPQSLRAERGRRAARIPSTVTGRGHNPRCDDGHTSDPHERTGSGAARNAVHDFQSSTRTSQQPQSRSHPPRSRRQMHADDIAIARRYLDAISARDFDTLPW